MDENMVLVSQDGLNYIFERLKKLVKQRIVIEGYPVTLSQIDRLIDYLEENK